MEESAPAFAKGLGAARLTGHARGAFTDAKEDKKGLLEAAHQGTFFLDEVALASDELQQILLRLVENPALRRLGDLRERPINVRFIAATNEDLQKQVDLGLFRADLKDRLGTMMLRLPKLIERQEEILPLAQHFLIEAAVQFGPAVSPVLAPEVQAFFMAYSWPGNIRELRSVCRTALAMAGSRDQINLEDLPVDFVDGLGTIGRTRYTLATDRRQGLRQALEDANGNKSEAARRLGISRQTLYRLLDGDGPAVSAECNVSADR